MEIALAVFGTLAGTALLAGLAFLFYRKSKQTESQISATRALTETLVEFKDALPSLKELPGLAGVIGRAAEAQAVQIRMLHDTIEKFSGILLQDGAGSSPASKRPGFEPYNEERASLNYEIEALVGEGLPRGEATQIAKERMIASAFRKGGAV